MFLQSNQEINPQEGLAVLIDIEVGALSQKSAPHAHTHDVCGSGLKPCDGA